MAELSSTPGHGAACSLFTGSTTVGSDHNPQCESLDYFLGRGKIARLLQRLEEGGALSSTLVMAGSDMGDPALHSTRNIPLILAGGDGTGLLGPTGKKLLTGQRLKAATDCPPTNPQWCELPELTLSAHNHVLVSIANLFGVDTDTVGFFDPRYLKQPKATVNGADSITGAYPGLLS